MLLSAANVGWRDVSRGLAAGAVPDAVRRAGAVRARARAGRAPTAVRPEPDGAPGRRVSRGDSRHACARPGSACACWWRSGVRRRWSSRSASFRSSTGCWPMSSERLWSSWTSSASATCSARAAACAACWLDLLGRRDTRQDLWAVRDLSLQPAARRVARAGRPQRRGQDDHAALAGGHHPADARSLRTRGRVASLLNVGAGFHPELSGRENVLLNGVILGLTRARSQRALRRHRRLRRARRRVHGHAGQALLERHVRAAGVCRGGPRRARRAAGRRSAVGRRRGVSGSFAASACSSFAIRGGRRSCSCRTTWPRSS